MPYYSNITHSSVRPHAERGFSLLELLIAAVITVIIVGASAAFVLRLFGRNAAFRETSEVDERRTSVSDLFRSNMDNAGHGLTQPDEPGSGTEALRFSGNADYTGSQGYLTRTRTSSSAPALSTRLLAAGTGQFTFAVTTTTGTTAALLGENNVGSRSIFVAGPVWVILEDGHQVATSQNHPLGVHQAGDLYIFQIENSAAESGMRVVAYYRVRAGSRSLLYRSIAPPPAYPLSLAVSCYVGETVSSLAMTGAPLVSREMQPARTALLPMADGERLASPVRITDDGARLFILAGDPNTDGFRTAEAVDGNLALAQESSPNTQTLRVVGPVRGALAAGDFLLLIDFAARRSVICAVESFSAGTLTIRRASSTAQAWERLWSPPQDAQHLFPSGSALLKLAPPIEWFWREASLLRREGAEPYTVADLGVNFFQVREIASASGDERTYELSIQLQSEGVETSEERTDSARQDFTLTVSPPALNQTYSQDP